MDVAEIDEIDYFKRGSDWGFGEEMQQEWNKIKAETNNKVSDKSANIREEYSMSKLLSFLFLLRDSPRHKARTPNHLVL
jgi:hypothetical protein